MRWVGKLVVFAGTAFLGYLVLLFVLGFALESTIESKMKARIAQALRADSVEVGDIDLSLLRGKVELSNLVVRRSGPGTVAIDIRAIDVEMRSMGGMMWDHDADRVVVRGADIELSAVGAATLRRGDSKSTHVGELVVEDSRLAVAPTSLLPGLGRAELKVAHARTREIEVRDSLSWLFGLVELDADLALPKEISVGVTYREKSLTVRGSVMGSAPITVPFEMPEPSLEDFEIGNIITLARSLMRALAPELAKRKLRDAMDDVVELLE